MNPEELIKLRKILYNFYEKINSFSKFQHHGIIVYTEKDIKVTVAKFRSSKNTETIEPIVDKNFKKKDVSIDNSKKITSPIIGTAYLAPEPGGKKFIEIGQKLKKGDTVMIVEAMKTMNHVPSPMDGVVKEISVEDGQPVEFGQTIPTLE